MARPKAKAPARRYHVSGQSIVTIASRDYYLGKHDSPEAIARYAVLIATYQAGGLSLPDDFELSLLDDRVAAVVGTSPVVAARQQKRQIILVRHVTAIANAHFASKYAKAPEELRRFKRICNQLDRHFGDVDAKDFGPVKLKEFRQKLVDGTVESDAKQISRTYINRLINNVVAIFRHGVSCELVSIDVVHRLKTLEPLRYGQTTASEPKRRKPVSIEHVRATAENLPPVVKAMIRVQVATGMRPIELFRMRPADIDRSGETWIYRPSTHKTERTGKEKLIPLVGDARDAITDYLQREPESFCFSPAESMTWRRSKSRSNRQTPLSCGNREGTNRKKKPKSVPKNYYTGNGYRQAIRRAAESAGVPHWTPYQIRHLSATVIRAVLGGLEDAQALLGHSTALMTEHYAAESLEAATRAAKAAPKL
jgi:integrase